MRGFSENDRYFRDFSKPFEIFSGTFRSLKSLLYFLWMLQDLLGLFGNFRCFFLPYGIFSGTFMIFRDFSRFFRNFLGVFEFFRKFSGLILHLYFDLAFSESCQFLFGIFRYFHPDFLEFFVNSLRLFEIFSGPFPEFPEPFEVYCELSSPKIYLNQMLFVVFRYILHYLRDFPGTCGIVQDFVQFLKFIVCVT